MCKSENNIPASNKFQQNISIEYPNPIILSAKKMKIQGVFLTSKYLPIVIFLLITLNSLCIVSAFPKPRPTIIADDVMSEDQVVVEEVMGMGMGMGMDMDMETTTASPNTAGASSSSGSDDELVGLESKLQLSQIMIQTTEVPSSVEAATPNYDDSSNYHSEQIQDQGKDSPKIETPLESEYGASPVEVLNSNAKHLSNETVITHLNSTSLEPPHNSHAKREYDEDRDRDQEVRDHANLNNPESYDEESTPEGIPYGGAYGVLDNASVSKNEPGNNNRNDRSSARDSSEGKLGGSDLNFRRLVPESETESESDTETESEKPQPTEAIISTQSSDQDDSSPVPQSGPEPEPEAEAEPTADVQEVVTTPDNIQSAQIQSNSTSSSSSSANPEPTSSGDGDLTKLPSKADQDEASTTNSSQDPISLTVSTKTSQENDLPTIFSKTSQEDSHENTNHHQEQNLNLTATSQELPVTVVQVHVQSHENNQNQQDETVVVDDTTQTLSQDTDINAINPMAVDAETQGLGPMNSDPVKYTDDSGQTSPPTSTLLDDAQKQDKIFVFKNNLQPAAAAAEGDFNHPTTENILPADSETDTSPFPEPGPEPVPAEEVEPRVEEVVVNQSQDDVMSMATSTPLPMLPMNVSESENIPEITPTNTMAIPTTTYDSNTEETRTTEIAPVTHSSPQDETNSMDSENITPESNFNSTVSPMTPTDSSNKPNPNSDSEFANIRMPRGDTATEHDVNATITFVNHGATYYFQSVADNSSLTAHCHKFSKIDVIPGTVTSEDFVREDNQLWDVALVNHPQGQDQEYWMINHKYSINMLNSYMSPNASSTFPNRNFIKLVQAGSCNKKFLIQSIQLNKCVQNEGIHKEIVLAQCDNNSSAQQWTAELLYQTNIVDEKSMITE